MSGFSFDRTWRIATVLLLIMLAVVLVFTLAVVSWGRNQQITTDMIRSCLREGMTKSECLSALDVHAVIATYPNDDLESVLLSQAGFGSWFVPQQTIQLIFENGKLVSVAVETAYGAGEQFYHIPVRDLHGSTGQ